jgi:2-polyprenyl-3-methyl-5-hydroxy-6-metoxy-1,4-benzoquinol methylase
MARERLRASPNFALGFAMDGRPYVAKEVEPYLQYWLTEQHRILLSLFSSRRGQAVGTAIDGYFRFTKTRRTQRSCAELLAAIEEMRSAKILVGRDDDTSRYDARMAHDYLTHRPFPHELARFIVDRAPVANGTRLLDLAGGPGSLAVQLAEAGADVSLMELSRGFLAAAREHAGKRRVALKTIHESCNRLLFHDETYDVITVSQALHWLDDVLVCRGVCRSLREGGSFFVVHAAVNPDSDHPLRLAQGDRSVLGGDGGRPFAVEAQALLARLTLLFEALGAPEVQRIDLAQPEGADGSASRIVLADAALFTQRRPFGMGFARALLSPVHLEAAGHAPQEFWADMEARCASAAPDRLMGTQDWAVLHFRRGGRPSESLLDTMAPVEIGWTDPVGNEPERRTRARRARPRRAGTHRTSASTFRERMSP